ncbi:hypothetical protein [Anabaena sp. 4-3]|nr:hypothetical protein [Anabaena sp. 4-3]
MADSGTKLRGWELKGFDYSNDYKNLTQPNHCQSWMGMRGKVTQKQQK